MVNVRKVAAWTPLLLSALLWPAGEVEGQDLITAGDLAGFASPDPDFRIPYGPGPLQFGKLRLPNGAGPHPIVAFIHGGCWLSAFDMEHAAPLEQKLAEEGYAVWSLEYRRVGNEGGGWPGTFLDVANGIDHLRDIAETHALDLSRVVVSGHSAGGMLALWAAARPRIPRSSEVWTENPLTAHHVVALAPAPDLGALHERGVCGNVIDGLMGGSPDERPARYDAASPLRLAPIGIPQTLLIGGLDRSWGPSGRAYYERAKAAGDADITVVDLPESGHFEMITPATSSWPLVLAEFRAAFARMGR